MAQPSHKVSICESDCPLACRIWRVIWRAPSPLPRRANIYAHLCPLVSSPHLVAVASQWIGWLGLDCFSEGGGGKVFTVTMTLSCTDSSLWAETPAHPSSTHYSSKRHHQSPPLSSSLSCFRGNILFPLRTGELWICMIIGLISVMVSFNCQLNII